ncbi:MAG: hypothetical protein JRG96_15715 [Deltaproteobacteria bacterium]|nr:hypothetical protein [Deltaproteobacteria bacterium]
MNYFTVQHRAHVLSLQSPPITVHLEVGHEQQEGAKKDLEESVQDIDEREASDVVGGSFFSLSSLRTLSVKRVFVPQKLSTAGYCSSGGCTSHHCSTGFLR